jgi:hypothetical protein
MPNIIVEIITKTECTLNTNTKINARSKNRTFQIFFTDFFAKPKITFVIKAATATFIPFNAF